MNAILTELFDEHEHAEQLEEKTKYERTGALYEKLEINYLTLRFAQQDYDLRLYESGKFNDKDDFILAAANKEHHIKIQIKSAQYYSGSGINKKGKKANKRLDCWSFNVRKPAVELYKKNGVKFFIFVTCHEELYSYSNIEPTKKTLRFLTWIMPTDDVLKYWNNRTEKADFTIDINDSLFESRYFDNIQLLVDACNG